MMSPREMVSRVDRWVHSRVLPWRLVLAVVGAASAFCLLAWAPAVEEWPDGIRTEGVVVEIQDRSADGGSAWVRYTTLDGAVIERWLPDEAADGALQIGDAYPLEYRRGDPEDARGLVTLQDERGMVHRFRPFAPWVGGAAIVLMIVWVRWGDPSDPAAPGAAPRPRRAR